MNFKEKIDYFFNVKAAPRLEKFTKHRITKAIMTGMSAPIVMTIIGSIFIILKTPPIDPNTTNTFFRAWLDWANANAALLDFGNLITMKFIAIYALVGIAVSLASSHKVRPINMVIISIACYIMLASNIIEGGISTQWFGASGLFPAAIIGIIVVELAVFLLKKGIKIKLPATVPPNVAEPLENMFMNAILFALTMVVHELFANLEHLSLK